MKFQDKKTSVTIVI